MPTVLIIEKNGSIKELAIKTWVEADLYKKAGFKTKDGFKCYTTWGATIEDITYSISLYGKTTGKANQENKYELPPPLDSTLFFGNCILVNTTDEGVGNLTAIEWNSIYEFLYGGFDNICEDDSDDDDDTADGLKLTKHGYVKDDFIANDSDDDDDDDDDEDDIRDEDEDDDRKKPAKKKAPISKKSAVKPDVLADDTEDNYLDCTNELCEEDYI